MVPKTMLNPIPDLWKNNNRKNKFRLSIKKFKICK